MAAPQDAPEQAFRLRKFQGTNTQFESTFLGPSFLARSENWYPTVSYRLGKRPGTTLVQQLAGSTTDLLAASGPNDAPWLFAFVVPRTAGGEPDTTAPATVVASQAEGAFGSPIASFPTSQAWGRMVQFRDRIYAGNGVDPLHTWKIGDTTSIQFQGITDLGPPPVATPTTVTSGPTIPSGTYSYAWAHLDTTTGSPTKGLYTGRTRTPDPTTNQGLVTIQDSQTCTFPAPGGTGPFRLFVSPRNYPIEYATMQADNIAAGGSVTLDTIDVTDTRVPMAGGLNVFRTGNMFLIWNNRVVFAGFNQDIYSVFATDVILPGLEQDAFNMGTLFPDFAKVPLPQPVTGIGVAGVTAEFDATAPLLFFTASKTFLVQGDPFDPAGAAVMVELSSRIGCIGHETIVNVPQGTIFCAMDSVYLIPPGGGYPTDIGWPIADQIRKVPVDARGRACATFHKQFYKLAIPSGPGDTTMSHQWWLDLRQGLTTTPSWWGPMTGVIPTALSSDPDSPFEVDRGYCAADSADGTASDILRTHQLSMFTDYNSATPTLPNPIRSRLTSGRFDADQPFLVKIMTRLRLIAQAFGMTNVHVRMETDGGATWQVDDILIGQDMEAAGEFQHQTPNPSGTCPPNKAFNTAKFGAIYPVEVQTITPYTRPRGLSVIVSLDHRPVISYNSAGQPIVPNFDIQLRDFELLYILSGRKVRYYREGVSH